MWSSCFWFCIPPPRPPPPPPPPRHHTPSFTHNFVTHHLSHSIFVTHLLSHTTLSHTIFRTPSSHTTLSHTIFHTPSSHTTLSPTIFHTHHLSPQLCHTTSLSHTIFVTHHLSHTIFVTHHLSHTIFVTHHLSHTIFVTHHLSHTIFVTHHLSHTSLSHTISHTPSLSHTIFVTTLSHTIFVTHHLSHTILGDMCLRFTWQAWRPTLRGKCGTLRHLPWFCVAGMALGDIYLRFAWQAWHFVTSTFVLRGRRGTWWQPPSFCVAGVTLMALGWLWWRALGALGRRWRRPTLRGRRGTWRHPPSFRVAGMALGDAAQLCVAGVALGDIHVRFPWLAWHADVALLDIHLRFAWQTGHLWHWAGSGGAWARLVAGDAAQLCVAGVALGGIHLRFASHAWQASTFVLRGRRGTYGTGLALVARLGALGRRCRRPTLRGRRGTWRHPPSFRVAGMALGDIRFRFAWQVWHFVTSTCVLRGSRGTWRHPPSFRVAGVALMASGWRFTFSCPAMNFSFCAVTAVSDMLWWLCTASWDPAHCSFATHHLSHTALSHTTFHTQLSHTRSYTQDFVTYTIFFVAHHLSHTTLSRTTLHIQLVLLLDPPPHSFVFPSFPVPATTFVTHYWKKLTCGVIRSFNFMFFAC